MTFICNYGKNLRSSHEKSFSASICFHIVHKKIFHRRLSIDENKSDNLIDRSRESTLIKTSLPINIDGRCVLVSGYCFPRVSLSQILACFERDVATNAKTTREKIIGRSKNEIQFISRMIGTFCEYTNLIPANFKAVAPFNARADGSLPFSTRTLSVADQSSHQHESSLIQRWTAESSHGTAESCVDRHKRRSIH